MTSPALAWNAAGHRLTASIAWREMTEVARREAASLLVAHPAHADWQRKLQRGKNPLAPTAEALFGEASTWPDDIRHDERFANDDHDPALAPRHRDWHYVNRLIGSGARRPAESSRPGALEQQLARLPGVVADPRRLPGERAEALAWLIHLVGDAHQPLHVVGWRRHDGSLDEGGLDTTVIDPQRQRGEVTSLHVWWDELPGPPWLRGVALQQRANELLTAHPAAGIAQRDADDWLQESQRLAESAVLPLARRQDCAACPPLSFSDNERTLAKNSAERRLSEAGVRLGRWLNRLLTPAGR